MAFGKRGFQVESCKLLKENKSFGALALMNFHQDFSLLVGENKIREIWMVTSSLTL